VEIRTKAKTSLDHLMYLPSFAEYLLQHRLNDFITTQMRFYEEANIPMMNLFGEISAEQLFQMVKSSAEELLTNLAQNRAEQHIETGIKKWMDDMLPVLKKEDIAAEDITLTMHVRKKTLLQFLPEYSNDSDQLVKLVQEIDLFISQSEITYINTYINLLKERLSATVSKEEQITSQLRENEYLYKRAEAITQLGSYKWELKTNELIWSDELYRIYELDLEKDTITFDYVGSFNYPEDTPKVRAEYSAAIEGKRPYDFHYRIKTKNNHTKILHARGEMVQNDSGEVVTIIGTVQDVTERQTLISTLSRNEKLYKQAEELVNMGNWNWDIKNNKIECTDHLYRIYGLEPQSEAITMDRLLSFVHPDDRDYVANTNREIDSKDLLDSTFRIITAKGETKILRSIAQVQRDENRNPVFVVGTERDITEKQTLINSLRKSERLYKQAQALAHVGNWSWDIKNNNIEWSDELYRIY
jgi:PAS domain S-box-containing protein